jgi:hypothetical protein
MRGSSITRSESFNGGRVVHDAMSDPEGGRFGPPQDFLSIGFKHSPKIKPLLENTKKLSDVKVADCDAIFVIGGLGPMVSFTDNAELHKLFVSFYEAGKVSATICHGSVILLRFAQRQRPGRSPTPYSCKARPTSRLQCATVCWFQASRARRADARPNLSSRRWKAEGLAHAREQFVCRHPTCHA